MRTVLLCLIAFVIGCGDDGVHHLPDGPPGGADATIPDGGGDDATLPDGGSSECTDGERDCQNNAPRVCTAGRWSAQAVCSGATPSCRAGACADPPQIALGTESSYRVRPDGTVASWGANGFGQLGDGTTQDRAAAISVPGLAGVVSVAAGFSHACAVIDDGTVRCWGNNGAGQLGDGTLTDHLIPTVVPGLADVAQIAIPSDHFGSQSTCARLNDGTVKCWGSNAYGQLGDGTHADHSSPASVPGLVNVAELVAGSGHVCARLQAGTVSCWGNASYGQTGNPIPNGGSDLTSPSPVAGLTNATSLVAGGVFTCALLQDGTAVCFGANASEVATFTPVAISGVTNAVAITADKGAHTCVRYADSTVGCWGFNTVGQLGDPAIPTGSASFVPQPTPGLANILEVRAGEGHTCARTLDGTLACWGDNLRGQLGDGQFGKRWTATPAVGVASATHVSAGFAHSCAVTGTGTMKCWGANHAGQVGDGTFGGVRRTPVVVAGMTNAVEVVEGLSYTCARLADSTVSCWGNGSNGVLGSTGQQQATPTPVAGGLTGVTQIAAKAEFTCARINTGAMSCWGQNNQGQLDDGTTTTGTTPTSAQLTGVQEVTTGEWFGCARLASSVSCWGVHPSGEFGDGTFSSVPSGATSSVTGLTDASALASGRFHACALRSNGTVVCWGGNLPSPDPVPGLTGVTAIAAGGYNTCALLADTTVRCWGNNQWGQLGDGTNVGRSSPTAVLGLTGVAQIAVGLSHACARLLDGTVRCWGDNYEGFIGDGTTPFRAAPVAIGSP